MKPALVALSALMLFSVSLPEALAANKKVTVATLAGTYECLLTSFSDAKATAGRFSIVVAKSGGVTVSGTVEETEPNCDSFEREDCTSRRSITFKFAKLTTPKKKSIYNQSALKKTTIDAASGFTLSGAVRTFVSGSIRYRDIYGIASLGAASGSLATTFSCFGPQTTK
jgi:hypothetical protein